MDDQRREVAPLETARAWDSARRLREPVAWTLLVLTAIGLLISAWLLFGMPGTPPITAPVTGPATAPGPVPVTTFGLRAAAVAPQFVAADIFALPIVSVILVAFAGGLTNRARQVVQTAISIQAITLGLGVLSWLGALGAHVRPGIWFIADASGTRDPGGRAYIHRRGAAVAGAPAADAAVPGLPGRRQGLRGRRRLGPEASLLKIIRTKRDTRCGDWAGRQEASGPRPPRLYSVGYPRSAGRQRRRDGAPSSRH